MDDTETEDGREEGKKRSGKGSGEAGGIRLPPNKLQEVMRNWEHLDSGKIIAHMTDFFSEWPARASANAEVSWPKANLKNRGFAIATNFLKFGQEISHLMNNLTRENIERLRMEYGILVAGGPAG
jgi:hypothetical protein